MPESVALSKGTAESEVMPSLKADGSFRPDIRWKPRSDVGAPPGSAVPLEEPENRLKNDVAVVGMEAVRCAICWPAAAIGRVSVASFSDSCRAPLLLRLYRRSISNARIRITVSPAMLPTTLPITCGVEMELSLVPLLAPFPVAAVGVLLAAGAPLLGAP